MKEGKEEKKVLELNRVCRIAFDKGLLDTHSGNIGMGIGGDILITKTGRSLIDLKPQDFTTIPVIKPEKGDKDGGASSEIGIYRFILKSFPDSTVFHSHPVNAIALTLNLRKNTNNRNGVSKSCTPLFKNLYKKYRELDEIIPLDFESAYFFPKIYVFPLNLIEDIKKNSLRPPFEAKDIFKENGVFMIKSHGSFAWGKTPLDALRWTMMLEASAEIILKCLSL
jgi:L-fuculose-phosphate aldolase